MASLYSARLRLRVLGRLEELVGRYPRSIFHRRGRWWDGMPFQEMRRRALMSMTWGEGKVFIRVGVVVVVLVALVGLVEEG